MFRTLIAGAIVLPLMSGAALASPPQLNMFLGNDTLTISKGLEALGYDVLSIGVDETGFEAEIIAQGMMYDVTVDIASGLIISVDSDHDSDGDV